VGDGREDREPVRPWQIFNPNTVWVQQDQYEKRILACKACDSFIKKLRVCKECGCHMPTKAKMQDAFCPLGKWNE
jgi:hypothetical protein